MPGNIQRYNIYRMLVTLAVLGWILGLVWSGEMEIGLLPFFRFVTVALGGLVWVVLRVRDYRPSTRFVVVQLALDAAAVSLLSGMAGGLHSFFTLLYFPTIAAGAWLLRREGALTAAAFASLGLVAMIALDRELKPLDVEGALVVYTEAMFRIFAFFLMAILVGHLGELLASTGLALQEERRSSRLLASEHDTVLDRVRAGVLTSDAEGRIVTINPFARELVGEVRDLPLASVFPEGVDRETWEEARPDGQRWICTAAPLPEGGRVIVVEDVTELARMRETAAQDERMVAVGRLAASMAHEIRNPLASLSGSLQLIGEEHPSRLAEIALGEAERLNRLVDDFLSAARRPNVERRRVDVYAIARDVCESFTRDPRFLHTVAARCEGASIAADADPDRLRQALWNLVLNGAQAMPRGGTVTVSVRGAASVGSRPDGVEVRVSDEGVGIAEADRERVFDPFYTTRTGGTGLGLLLVKQVVQGHGGHIAVMPRSRNGTEIQLWLPRYCTDAR